MKFKYFRECLSIFFHSIKVGYELMTGFFRLTKLPMPIVTVFGGAKADKAGIFYRQADDFAYRCVKNGISIVTGGGPGIMTAANCGAARARKKGQKARTLGIVVSGVDQNYENPCADILSVSYFFMRKWLLIRYSIGFVVFPGGIGTMDELFDLLNMIKHHRVPELPVVLIGKEYWSPIVQWFEKSALKSGLLNKRLTKLFIVTDSIDEAYEVIHSICKIYSES
ncbi:LOG family protein [bacterium]|nr:LOG family protein [bacterium]